MRKRGDRRREVVRRRGEGSTESLSRPRVSCVRSFEPMEKPSKISAKSSAKITFEGISHITYTSKPSWPRSSPFFFISSRHFLPYT